MVGELNSPTISGEFVMKVLFCNRHYIGGIWIDARLSDGSKPFCQCPNVLGFPKLVDYLEPSAMQVPEGYEILYRKELDVISASSDVTYHPRLFRIPCKGRTEDTIEVLISDVEL